MKISALWITKNEAGKIERSMRSVMDIADEMVVVDTGSTDGTEEIAQNLGARIEHFEWVNDFSAARNFALSKVDGDIIIFPDADEWFEPPLGKAHRIKLEDTAKNGKATFVRMERHNFDPETGKSFGTDTEQRIIFGGLRRGRYVGAIHERFETNTSERVAFADDSFRLMHDGYTVEGLPEKAARNLDILLKAVQDAPDDFNQAVNRRYIMRESTIIGDEAQAATATQWLVEHPQLVQEVTRLMPKHGYPLPLSVYDICAKSPYRARCSRQQIHKNITEMCCKVLASYPAAAFYEPMYQIRFDVWEAELLQNIDGITQRAEGLRRQFGELDLLDYHNIAIEAYTETARGFRRRGNREQTFDYAAKALRQFDENRNAAALRLLLWSIRGTQTVDIIKFLLSLFDIKRRNHLDILTNALLIEGFNEVYAYFMKKKVEAGWAKKAELMHLMIMLGNAQGAAQKAAEVGDDDIDARRQLLFLAVACTQDKAILEQYREEMGTAYAAAADAMFEGRRLPAYDQGTRRIYDLVALKNYNLVAFAGGRAAANKMLDVFRTGTDNSFMTQAQYYQDCGLEREFFEDVSPEHLQVIEPASKVKLAELYAQVGDWQASYDILAELPKMAGAVGPDFLNMCSMLKELAPEPFGNQAMELYETYHPIYEEMVDLQDIVNTGYYPESDDKKQRRQLAGMSLTDFEKLGTVPDVPAIPGQTKVYVNAGGVLAGKKCYYAAAQCCSKALAYGESSYELWAVVVRVFEGVKNAALAAHASQQCAEYTKQMDDDVSAMLAGAAEQSAETLVTLMKEQLAKMSLPARYALARSSAQYPFYGRLDEENGDYSLFEQRAAELHSHATDFAWLYGRLADYSSKRVLQAYLATLLRLDPDAFAGVTDRRYPQYFDPALLRCGPEDVVVDLGAFTGDTLEDYVAVYGKNSYRRYYAYEITQDSTDALREKAEHYPNVEVRHKGASDQAGVMHLAEHEVSSSANKLEGEAGTAIETVALDEDIAEPITLLKMDIEGAEQAAIRGAMRHIREDKPKLALSLYYSYEDMWKIPRMIDEICPGYAFYLKYYGGPLVPSELILIGIYTGEQKAEED